MKTTILIISTLLCASLASAQTNYYTQTKTFYENGYTYQCDVPEWKLVTLYNKNNTFTYVESVYKTTGKPIPIDEYPLLFEEETWTKPRYHSIVNNAFSATEKQRLKGNYSSIAMYISPETGKITEVNFTFASFGPFATIPVSIYRSIETKLKQELWFIPTAEGKKLNYILLWFSLEIQ